MHRITIVALMLVFAVGCLSQTVPAEPNPSAPPIGNARDDRNRPRVAGTITALDGKRITLKTMDGKSVTASVTDETQFRKDRAAAKLEDFKVGEMVFIRGRATSNHTWQADVVATRTGGSQEFRDGMGKRFIAGEIKSMDGMHLVIRRLDGTTQTINVDENTSFRKQSESITLADLTVGDHVFGRGEMKNGVFVPTTLLVGDPGMMGREELRRKAGDEPR